MSKVTKFHGCSREEAEEFATENEGEEWTQGANAQTTRISGVYITYSYTSEMLVMQGKPEKVRPMAEKFTRFTELRNPILEEEGELELPSASNDPAQEKEENTNQVHRQWIPPNNRLYETDEEVWQQENEMTMGYWDEELKDVVLYHKGRRNPKMTINPMEEEWKEAQKRKQKERNEWREWNEWEDWQGRKWK